MEQQVAGGGDRVARAGTNLMKRTELRGPRRAEKAVPGARTEPHDAGESGFELAKADSAQKRSEISAEGENNAAIFVRGVDGDHQENGGAAEWRGNDLRNNGASRGPSVDRIRRHRSCSCKGSKSFVSYKTPARGERLPSSRRKDPRRESARGRTLGGQKYRLRYM